MNLSGRLSRLEANLSPDTVRVVEGHSDAEINKRVADLIAAGKAYPGDLFVGLLRFAGGSHELA